jgi:hypothetical protein
MDFWRLSIGAKKFEVTIWALFTGVTGPNFFKRASADSHAAQGCH